MVDSFGGHMGKVGIYWLNKPLDAFFLPLSYDLADSVAYGKWMISPEDHATYWDAHVREDPIRLLARRHRENYSCLPRGRVSYDTIAKRYYVYHGNWLTPQVQQLLMQEFSLEEADTIFEFDTHYCV
ncbi:MAG TPA: hypothetical protein VMX33_13125 [bacterium]|nr:hypothetical protein [bacterium]